MQINEPDKHKYSPVRSGNDLTELNKWIMWAKKNHPEQKFILVNDYKRHIKDKEHREYWKMRHSMSSGKSKYTIFGSY